MVKIKHVTEIIAHGLPKCRKYDGRILAHDGVAVLLPVIDGDNLHWKCSHPECDYEVR